ncbi:MAG TPA: tyrosine-type recombinase/integrase [Jiangellaceae bacterium]
MSKRRGFGNVRKLPSGRFQARYVGPDGLTKRAPRTFERRRDAEDWLADQQASIARGDWLDPDAGRVPLSEYGQAWLDDRDLAVRTHERYEEVWRLRIVPELGHLPIMDVREGTVRGWRRRLLETGVGPATVAKSYRVLRAIMNTAVDDGLIRRNPCRIKGAGDDGSAERPTLTITEVYKVAGEMAPRYWTLVLLATFTTLRFGELAALRRRDLDLDNGVVTVKRSLAELKSGKLVVKGPKTEAGKRRVAIPEAIMDDVRTHLAKYAGDGPDGLVFIGPMGGCLRRQNFRQHWTKALKAAGVEPIHFHDLRHTGNTLAASTGASTKELMKRMGHSSSRAALIYQHATDSRDRVIADAISAQISDSRKPSGTKGQPSPASSGT